VRAIDKPVASLGFAGAEPQSRRRCRIFYYVCVAGLFSRIVLSSGSALSPWALQTDPFFIKRRVAEHTSCHGDLEEEDIAPCLRNLPLEKLLQTRPGAPR
jgi:Carboxylesterase family